MDSQCNLKGFFFPSYKRRFRSFNQSKSVTCTTSSNKKGTLLSPVAAFKLLKLLFLPSSIQSIAKHPQTLCVSCIVQDFSFNLPPIKAQSVPPHQPLSFKTKGLYFEWLPELSFHSEHIPEKTFNHVGGPSNSLTLLSDATTTILQRASGIRLEYTHMYSLPDIVYKPAQVRMEGPEFWG